MKMMKTKRDSNLKLCSSLSINLELEVAEVLADLANPTEINTHEQTASFSPFPNEYSVQTSPLHLALRPNNEDHAVVVQQNGGRESRMTVRKPRQAGEDTEFSPNSNGSKTCAKTIQDLNVVPEDYVVEGQQDSEKECHIMVTEMKQTEETNEIQQNPYDGKSSARPVSCKSRREMNRLTEDQKAARKLRRMLANRLSARQTILKRQALCDELAKKAAELECENDNLKKEKEAVMRECDSLKSTNERLKAQLNMTGVTEKVEVEEVDQTQEKVEVEEVDETQEGPKFNNGHTPTSPYLSTPQYVIFNQPSSLPCVLPYITPGSYIVQPAPQDSIIVASQAPVLANGINCSLLEHENPSRMNIPRNTSYALPYHWFIPPLHQADRVPPQSMDLADKLNVTNQSSISSYRKSIADIKKDQRLPPNKKRGEASTSTEAIRPSVKADHGKTSRKKLAHKPKVTSEAATDSSSKGNVGLNASQNDAGNRRNEVATCAAATSSSSEENPEQPVDSLLRRQMDAYTTATARKRRKDVIKIKNFQYSRQSRVNLVSRYQAIR